MTCIGTKFEVVPSTGLGGNIFTRNVLNKRTHAQTDRRCTNLGTKLVTLFTKEKSGYNKGKVFQSNMSKNTVDGNCMTKKMLIVMFSKKSAIGEKIHTKE